MGKSPAFLWYPKDILASARVQMMSMAEECAYRRLIDFCWINGSVPADPVKAARLVGKGCSVEVVKVALEMFIVNPDDESQLIHDRLEEEKVKQTENSKKRKIAAEARWNKKGEYTDASGKQAKSKSNANAMQTDMQNDALHIAIPSSLSYTGERGKPVNEDIEIQLEEMLETIRLGYGTNDLPKREKWITVAKRAIDKSVPAESLVIAYKQLKSEPRSFDISPQNVYDRALEIAPKPKKPILNIADCPDCEGEGFIEVNGKGVKCIHEKLMQISLKA